MAENPCSLRRQLESCEDHESYSLFRCRALRVDGRWNKFILWLFHSATKPAFYLCVCELTHLHSHTVLSLSFSFIFPGLFYYQDPKNQHQTSKSTQTQRSSDNLFHVQAAGNVVAPMESVMTVWISDLGLG